MFLGGGIPQQLNLTELKLNKNIIIHITLMVQSYLRFKAD